jgi:GntP family gluconate:H+ symporter
VNLAVCLQQAKGAFLTGQDAASHRSSAPGLGLTLTTILLPVALMLMATLGEVFVTTGSTARSVSSFIGHPGVAMLASVLFAFWSFGIARGFDRARLLKSTEECLGPVALVVLIVGAGGGFNRVLREGGVADAIARLAQDAQLSPLLLGWLVAAVIRVATGSATVAITAAAGLLAQVVAGRSDVNLELLVIAMGAGSLILSHLNDGGFWFVKEYLGLSVPQTLKTWTVLETIASVVALVLALALDAVF